MPGTETLKTAEKPNAGAAAGRGPAGGRGELEICVDAGSFPPELPISGAPSSLFLFFFLRHLLFTHCFLLVLFFSLNGPSHRWLPRTVVAVLTALMAPQSSAHRMSRSPAFTDSPAASVLQVSFCIWGKRTPGLFVHPGLESQVHKQRIPQKVLSWEEARTKMSFILAEMLWQCLLC